MSDSKSGGSQKWDAMSDAQKKDTFESMPAEQQKGLSYSEWISQGYQQKYENWMPWIEDKYLQWFGNDNKASYATKESLDKTKVTGIAQVDTLQDGVNNLVGGQVGKGGLLQPLGDAASKEGINRAERGGKDESGGYGGPGSSVTNPIADNAKAGGEGVASGAQGAASSVADGAKGAGGYLNSMNPFGEKK